MGAGRRFQRRRGIGGWGLLGHMRRPSARRFGALLDNLARRRLQQGAVLLQHPAVAAVAAGKGQGVGMPASPECSPCMEMRLHAPCQ